MLLRSGDGRFEWEGGGGLRFFLKAPGLGEMFRWQPCEDGKWEFIWDKPQWVASIQGQLGTVRRWLKKKAAR